jgi:PilZ domain
MNAATAERRRSDRLWLTIPLRFEDVDSKGETVELDGRAVSLSRHGARIQLHRTLDKGQEIRVKSPFGHREAGFRVVQPIVPPGEKDGEYGVECVDENENFWGIEFPTREEGEKADAKALLECRMCHGLALLPLTLTEVEALRSIGKVGKLCQTCGVDTPWRYAEGRVPPTQLTEAVLNAMEEEDPNWISTFMDPAGRSHRRIIMQVPLGVRDSRGSAEITRTENISKSGFCFTSDKRYLAGEIVMSVFPLDPVTKRTELPARIVRELAIEGSGRKFYGATFESRTSSEPLVA